MKINEVEKILDVSKATIRFYEKEGLLRPTRNTNSYRDYSDTDIQLPKKIIVLRKIGVPVENIKLVLHDELPLREVISQNMDSLHQQMEELAGALKLCATIHKQEESLASFDEEYYWKVIHEEEEKGNKFFDIVNDVIEFEKRVIADEFGLLDNEGKMKYPLGKSILIAVVMCLASGLLWFFLSGMDVNEFIEGFTFPVVCIIISSIFGLPVFFLEKKHPKAARIIKKNRLGAMCGILGIHRAADFFRNHMMFLYFQCL